MKKLRLKRIIAIATFFCIMVVSFTSCSRSKPTSNSSSSSVSAASQAAESSSAVQSSSAQTTVLSNIASAASDVYGNSKQAASYSGKSYFAKDAKKKETKISINNKKIIAPTIASTAAANSIIKRTQIEGVDGSFKDAKINESPRNLGGKSYIFATFWPGNWQGKSSVEAQRCSAAKSAVEKDYNCKIQIKTMNLGTYIKDMTTAKSGGKVYANVLEFLNDPVITTGDLTDLRSVNTVGVKTNQWNPVQTLVASYKGGVYGVGVRYDTVEHDIILYNKALAQKYNLGDFYTMVSKGQWTDDMFLQVCERFKKENNNSSISACQGLYLQELLGLVYTNWSSPFGITQSKYIFNGTDSSVLDVLNYCQSFVKAGLYNTKCTASDFKSNGTYEQTNEDAALSQTNFDSGKTLFFIGSDTILPDAVKRAKSDYGLLPLPKGPAADGYTAVIRNAKFFSLFSGDPDSQNSGALLTALANRTNIKTSGIISNNTSLVRDVQSVNTLTENYKYKQILNVELCSAGKLPNIYYGAALSSVIKQASSPKQAMDSISKSAQSEINKNFGQ